MSRALGLGLFDEYEGIIRLSIAGQVQNEFWDFNLFWCRKSNWQLRILFANFKRIFFEMAYFLLPKIS